MKTKLKPRRLVVASTTKIADHTGARWECFIGEINEDNAPFRAYGSTLKECRANAKWLVSVASGDAGLRGGEKA